MKLSDLKQHQGLPLTVVAIISGATSQSWSGPFELGKIKTLQDDPPIAVYLLGNMNNGDFVPGYVGRVGVDGSSKGSLKSRLNGHELEEHFTHFKYWKPYNMYSQSEARLKAAKKEQAIFDLGAKNPGTDRQFIYWEYNEMRPSVPSNT